VATKPEPDDMNASDVQGDVRSNVQSSMQDSNLDNSSGDRLDDPLARFRNWRGFLAATIAVNALFVYGMIANVADPVVSTWFKAMIWLPFNAIATALYLMFMIRLSVFGLHYVALCIALIVANWGIMFGAGG
jgi:hypothetical protein